MNTSFNNNTALRRLIAAFIAAFVLSILSGCVAIGGNNSIPERTERVTLSQTGETEDAEHTRPHQLPDGSLQLGPDGKPVMVTEIKTPAQLRHENAQNGMKNLTQQNADIKNPGVAQAPGFWERTLGPTRSYPANVDGIPNVNGVPVGGYVVDAGTVTTPNYGYEEYVEALRRGGSPRGRR